jgi:hypothetical protein
LRCGVSDISYYAGSDAPTVTEDEPVAKKTAKPKAVPKNDEDMVKNLSEKVKSGESPFPNDVENWDAHYG